MSLCGLGLVVSWIICVCVCFIGIKVTLFQICSQSSCYHSSGANSFIGSFSVCFSVLVLDTVSFFLSSLYDCHLKLCPLWHTLCPEESMKKGEEGQAVASCSSSVGCGTPSCAHWRSAAGMAGCPLFTGLLLHCLLTFVLLADLLTNTFFCIHRLTHTRMHAHAHMHTRTP